jgi:hypothetical protein
LTDSGQALTDTWTYDSFGEVVASTGSAANPFAYLGGTGAYTDEDTGTILTSAGYYDPRIDRLLSGQVVGAGPVHTGEGALRQFLAVGGAAGCDISKGKGVKTPPAPGVPACLRDCVNQHEQKHVDDINTDSCCARAKKCWDKAKGKNKAKQQQYCQDLWNKYANAVVPWFECWAYRVSVQCAQALVGAPLNKHCHDVCTRNLALWKGFAKAYCDQAHGMTRPKCVFKDDGTPNPKWREG